MVNNRKRSSSVDLRDVKIPKNTEETNEGLKVLGSESRTADDSIENDKSWMVESVHRVQM